MNQPLLDGLTATLRGLTFDESSWLRGWIAGRYGADIYSVNMNRYHEGYRRGEADAKKGAGDDAAESG